VNGPIIIVGVPRSGTSLLTAVLNRHAAVYIAPESHFFFRIWGNRRRLGNLNDPNNFDKLIPYFQTLKHIGSGWANTEINIPMLKERFYQQDEQNYDNLFLSFLKMLAEDKSKQIFGEKTPLHLYFLPHMVKSFKNIKIIHVIRDGRGTVSSLLGTDWGKDLITYSIFWKNCLNLVRKFKAEANFKMLEVKFEDLVVQPEKSLNHICNFLNVNYTSSLMDVIYTNTSSKSARNSYTKGFDEKAIKRWKTNLSTDQIALIESIIHQELLAFDYELETNKHSGLSGLTQLQLKLKEDYQLFRTTILRKVCQLGTVSLFNPDYKVPIKN
jgi:hypothetical protein